MLKEYKNGSKKLTYKEFFKEFIKELKEKNQKRIKGLGKFYISTFKVHGQILKQKNNNIYNIQPKTVKTIKFKPYYSLKKQINN